MVTEWVESGANLGVDWRPGLASIIEKRLERLLKRPEPDTSDPRDALIKELMGALQIVDDDVRHHLRSEKIYHSLLRAHAVEAVRNALSKVEGK